MYLEFFNSFLGNDYIVEIQKKKNFLVKLLDYIQRNNTIINLYIEKLPIMTTTTTTHCETGTWPHRMVCV